MINEQQAHIYCKDDISKIENYDRAVNDTTQTWHLHHRLELTLDGEFAHTIIELRRLGMYYNRPYFELIFLPKGEHRRMHMIEKARAAGHTFRMSISMKGKNKGKIASAESRKKMSESHKGKTHSAETRNKMKAAWARRRQEKVHE